MLIEYNCYLELITKVNNFNSKNANKELEYNCYLELSSGVMWIGSLVLGTPARSEAAPPSCQDFICQQVDSPKLLFLLYLSLSPTELLALKYIKDTKQLPYHEQSHFKGGFNLRTGRKNVQDGFQNIIRGNFLGSLTN